MSKLDNILVFLRLKKVDTSNLNHLPELHYGDTREKIEGSLRVARDMKYGDWNTAGLILSDLRLHIDKLHLPTRVISRFEKDQIMETDEWIKIKEFRDFEDLTWEERYKRLQEHHEKETKFLINKVREIVGKL